MDRRERTVTDKWDLRPKGAGAGNQDGGAHLSSEQLGKGGRRIAMSWRPTWATWIDPPVSRKQNSQWGE